MLVGLRECLQLVGAMVERKSYFDYGPDHRIVLNSEYCEYFVGYGLFPGRGGCLPAQPVLADVAGEFRTFAAGICLYAGFVPDPLGVCPRLALLDSGRRGKLGDSGQRGVLHFAVVVCGLAAFFYAAFNAIGSNVVLRRRAGSAALFGVTPAEAHSSAARIAVLRGGWRRPAAPRGAQNNEVLIPAEEKTS